ncbi:MAG: hypothetical protein AVDCRST_MAG91-813, partial [uncultured Sphingomonadaceae bacterium]
MTSINRLASLSLAATASAFAVAACTHIAGPQQAPVATDWRTYGVNLEGDRFSLLTQIDRSNVTQLREVWRFETGAGGIQTSPLMIGGLLYTITPQQDVVALDAATGKPVWTWDAPEPAEQQVRGLSYWESNGQ